MDVLIGHEEPSINDAIQGDFDPYLITVARRLVARQDLRWPLECDAFDELIAEGRVGASTELKATRQAAPFLYLRQSRAERLRMALVAAARAMARHLLAQSRMP